MKSLIISAPFGNYIQPPYATATLGTFTWHERPGRFMQTLKTLRYRRKDRAWVNNIGLRNPGIGGLLLNSAPDKIVSIHGFDDGEWHNLLYALNLVPPLATELNFGCPNIDGQTYSLELLRDLIEIADMRLIAKIPPVGFKEIVENCLAAGITAFHATNTLPVGEGGMSGKPLKPFALDVVRYLRATYPEALIIGGGGITVPADIEEYREAGADHFAVGTGSLALWRLKALANA